MDLKKSFSKIFSYDENKQYSYKLSETQVSNNIIENTKSDSKKISSSLKENQEYITVKYNALINSDIVLRNLNINIKGKLYPALLFYIDGMVDSDILNNCIMKPLMMKNQNNTFSDKESIITTPPKSISEDGSENKYRQANNSSISDYIYNSLITDSI